MPHPPPGVASISFLVDRKDGSSRLSPRPQSPLQQGTEIDATHRSGASSTRRAPSATTTGSFERIRILFSACLLVVLGVPAGPLATHTFFPARARARCGPRRRSRRSRRLRSPRARATRPPCSCPLRPCRLPPPIIRALLALLLLPLALSAPAASASSLGWLCLLDHPPFSVHFQKKLPFALSPLL